MNNDLIEARKKFYQLYLDGVGDTTSFIEWLMRMFELDELDNEGEEEDGRYWFASPDVLEKWKTEHDMKVGFIEKGKE